jgi:DNA-binding XRE family transcriptional regulator
MIGKQPERDVAPPRQRLARCTRQRADHSREAPVVVTQEALAHSAGITVGHLSKIERGHANPTWETIQGIAAALEVSVPRLAEQAER